VRVAYLAFFAVLLVFTGICWLLVGSFVVGDLPGGIRTLAALWLASVAPATLLFWNVITGGYPSSFVRCTLFRFFWYSQFLVVMLVPVVVPAFVVGVLFGSGAGFGRYAVLWGAPLLVVLGVWGYFGSRRLVVRRLEVRLPTLPAALDGLVIAQMTDHHVGPHTSRRHLARVADAVRAAKPDIIAHTGDQVDDYPRDMEVFAEHLGGLTAPLGVFAIAGNHDVYAGWAKVRAGLERMGARVLVNAAERLTYRGTDFWLAGTGDPAGTAMARFSRDGMSPAPDIAKTLSGVPAGAFHIVLAHNPLLWPALAKRGVPLTLSGHTHWGQLAIPRLNWSLAGVFLRHAMGAYEEAGSLLYIGAGTNYWGIPFRIGAPPEVVILTLRAAARPEIAAA